MLKSMTGFGRCEELIDGFHIQTQIKSVNHRYSDFTIKAPRYYAFLEDKIRSFAMDKIARGKVEILISISKKEDDDKIITLDHTVAKGYIDALRSLTEYGLKDDLTISALSDFSDIFNVEYKEVDEEQITHITTSVLQKAFDDFLEMRRTEGLRLKESLISHLGSLVEYIDIVEKRTPETIDAYRNRLYNKIKEVLEDKNIDENRVLTEVAVFSDKIAVDEETVRLRSHIKAFKDAMDTDAPVGKKLDFIVQEMNRETNTIGSKANDLGITATVVEMKSVIEKIREQIQNIE